MANRMKTPPSLTSVLFRRLESSLFGICNLVAIALVLFRLQEAGATTPGCAAISAQSLRASPRSFSRDVTDEKKLSREEFFKFGYSANWLTSGSTSGSFILGRGTELSVLVDTACLGRRGSDPQTSSLAFLTPTKVGFGRQGGLRSVPWTLDREWSFNALQDAFQRETCVVMASPDVPLHLNRSMNDPLIDRQTHLESLHFFQSFAHFLMPVLIRVPVSIAIVDSGVDFQHPDLRSNRWINKLEIPGNGVDDEGNGYIDDVDGFNFSDGKSASGPQGTWPDNKHGTHVAGLAAARIDNSIGGVGIAGTAKIMSLNIFGWQDSTRSSTLENALRYAADQHADVINLSVGGREFSKTMRSALEYAVGKGSFIVTAAGNDGIEICNAPGTSHYVSPAVFGSSLEGMIVVGSTDVSTNAISLFSNFSSEFVEIMAPGAYVSKGPTIIGLFSTSTGKGYTMLAGTSMSAPLVSGAAALVATWLKVYHYDVTPNRIKTILLESARRDSMLMDKVAGGRVLDLLTLANDLEKNYPAQKSIRR